MLWNDDDFTHIFWQSSLFVPELFPPSLWLHLCKKQYVAVLRTKPWRATVWAWGGWHLGPALLPARWQGSPPAARVCVYASLLKGQKQCRSCISHTGLFAESASHCGLCVYFGVLRDSSVRFRGWRGLPDIPLTKKTSSLLHFYY